MTCCKLDDELPLRGSSCLLCSLFLCTPFVKKNTVVSTEALIQSRFHEEWCGSRPVGDYPVAMVPL
jgi:hypothetical protein